MSDGEEYTFEYRCPYCGGEIDYYKEDDSAPTTLYCMECEWEPKDLFKPLIYKYVTYGPKISAMDLMKAKGWAES